VSTTTTDELMALLVQHRACAHCQTSINDQAVSANDERGWIHTDTGLYRCPPGTWRTDDVPGLAYAEPIDSEAAIEERIEKACEETERVTRDDCEETMYDDEQLEDAKDEAYKQGRADYSTELNGAITSALHGFGRDLSVLERRVFDRMNDVLTEAWESVDV
jgi:hypothetical protein